MLDKARKITKMDLNPSPMEVPIQGKPAPKGGRQYGDLGQIQKIIKGDKK